MDEFLEETAFRLIYFYRLDDGTYFLQLQCRDREGQVSSIPLPFFLDDGEDAIADALLLLFRSLDLMPPEFFEAPGILEPGTYAYYVECAWDGRNFRDAYLLDQNSHLTAAFRPIRDEPFTTDYMEEGVSYDFYLTAERLIRAFETAAERLATFQLRRNEPDMEPETIIELDLHTLPDLD